MKMIKVVHCNIRYKFIHDHSHTYIFTNICLQLYLQNTLPYSIAKLYYIIDIFFKTQYFPTRYLECSQKCSTILLPLHGESIVDFLYAVVLRV